MNCYLGQTGTVSLHDSVTVSEALRDLPFMLPFTLDIKSSTFVPKEENFVSVVWDVCRQLLKCSLEFPNPKRPHFFRAKYEYISMTLLAFELDLDSKPRSIFFEKIAPIMPSAVFALQRINHTRDRSPVLCSDLINWCLIENFCRVSSRGERQNIFETQLISYALVLSCTQAPKCKQQQFRTPTPLVKNMTARQRVTYSAK